ncbi:hypothetical protein ACT8ZV_11855 [Nocardioides sp. MAHUQ-72]|uniref:hypothetical protein n=1 Tax=unclassified Nocardioides TaxID=2615069 RepID=UPI00361E31C2
MRLWYARRGVTWTPLLACCALAVGAALVGHRWPASLAVLLPAALAGCAAGAGFVFDEAATQVVSVTPRGAGWRRTTRLAVVVVPLAVWLVVVATLPRTVVPDRSGWVTVGVACLLLSAGASGLCARRAVSAPGSTVAAGVAGLVLMPLVVGPLVGWEPVLPLGEFSSGLTAFWSAAIALGTLLASWGPRPGLR